VAPGPAVWPAPRNICRHQVAAGGQHLAKLYKNGPQTFQRQTQAHGARRGGVAREQNQLEGENQPACTFVRQNKFIQTKRKAT